MKCYNESVIQQYIDKEFTHEEMSLIEKHLNHCEHCQNLAEELRERSSAIKSLLNQQLSYANDNSIPTFNPPTKRIKLRHKRIAIALTAAATLTLIIISNYQKHNTQSDYILYQTLDFEMDANKPIGEQTFTMQLVDQNGKPIDLDSQHF